MGYNAYAKMERINLERWGIKGPAVPEVFDGIRVWEKDANGKRSAAPVFHRVSDLEKHAVHFIREKCTDLRFNLSDEKHAGLEDFDGTSLKEHQVPYNFQMDMDRRCLEVAIH